MEGRCTDPGRYMGDRWISTNLMASTYIWLPLTLEGTNATLVRPSGIPFGGGRLTPTADGQLQLDPLPRWDLGLGRR